MFTVAVLTSSEYLIIHDETLVVLCFVSFLIFTYVLLKDILVASLDERAVLIEKEFNDSFKLKEQTLVLLASHHAKQVSLLQEINSILLFTKGELNKIVQSRQSALRTRLVSEIRSKLGLALKKEDAFFQYVQKSTNNMIQQSIQDRLNSEEGSSIKDSCFEEGIRLIEQVK
jgi:F0F1-type ATP synthase membrane subunit b/b'